MKTEAPTKSIGGYLLTHDGNRWTVRSPQGTWMGDFRLQRDAKAFASQIVRFTGDVTGRPDGNALAESLDPDSVVGRALRARIVPYVRTVGRSGEYRTVEDFTANVLDYRLEPYPAPVPYDSADAYQLV
jgi:hypothetical protein